MYYSYIVHKILMNTLRYHLVCNFTCLVIVIIIHLFTNVYGFYFHFSFNCSGVLTMIRKITIMVLM